MSKHAGLRAPADRSGATTATLAMVGLLAAVVALLAVVRPADQGSPDNLAADVALATPQTTGPSPQTTSPSDRTTRKSPSVKPQKVGKSGKTLRRKAQAVVHVEPTTFRVSSFNLLGASHTKPGGDKDGWAAATTRMGWALSVLRGYDVDVVGFQEFEDPQYYEFRRLVGSEFEVYPGPGADPGAVRQSIAWRTDTWEVVSAATIAIPYFRGSRIPMPYVRLHNIASGQDVYFLNVHNPATTSRWGNNERWRDLATSLEIGLINKLWEETGVPVVVTGDFNERDEVFCRMTALATVRAANGGSVGAGCSPPSHMDVDWIFGSLAIEFSGFVSQQGGLVQRATDHPIVVSAAEIPPQTGR